MKAFRQKNGLMQDADFGFAFVRVAISSPPNGRPSSQSPLVPPPGGDHDGVCVFMSARCKHQRLRHNIREIESIHPCECHHQHAAWEWDPWEDTQGRHQFPSKEEAEYSATLAFAIAVSVSWWAARVGHARLHVPRMPPLEACGRRQHWLEIDPRAMRSWAMTPLAITLGLPPLHPEERARLPAVVRVADLLTDGQLPPDVVYVGQGHHSHRVPRSQWASPFVQGHLYGGRLASALCGLHPCQSSGGAAFPAGQTIGMRL